MQPIYLLADSQLLFWREHGVLWLQSVRERLACSNPKAAYVGASNGDKPEFYEIFEVAMSGIGIRDCRMVCTYERVLSPMDEVFIQSADLILLAGGDVKKGWDAFTAVGLDKLIHKRYHEGALLMGISAGAVQLGMLGWGEEGGVMQLFETLQLLPFMIGAHEEEQGWVTLKEVLRHARDSKEEHACAWNLGLGIPSGGGVIYTPEEGVKAIRRPFVSF